MQVGQGALGLVRRGQARLHGRHQGPVPIDEEAGLLILGAVLAGQHGVEGALRLRVMPMAAAQDLVPAAAHKGGAGVGVAVGACLLVPHLVVHGLAGALVQLPGAGFLPAVPGEAA